jgi:hypothetical protein
MGGTVSDKKCNYTITIRVERTDINTIKDNTSYNTREYDQEGPTTSLFNVTRKANELDELVKFAKDALDLI